MNDENTTPAEPAGESTPPPGAPGLFRCAAPGMMAEAYRRAGLKDVAERQLQGEMSLESAERY